MTAPERSRHAARILAGMTDHDVKNRVREAIVDVVGDPLRLNEADRAEWVAAAARVGGPIVAPT